MSLRTSALLSLCMLPLWSCGRSTDRPAPAHTEQAATTTDQFAPYGPPPFALDNVQGEWVNLETQLIRPILVTADEQRVAVISEPDNRVVFYDAALTTLLGEVVVGQGPAALAERPLSSPAEVWVSLRHQSAVAVIDLSTLRITSLVRPPIAPTQIGARLANHPGGIAFSPDGARAYVAASDSDALLVFDTTTKSFLQSIPLAASHNGLTPALNEPYAVVAGGSDIYVISQVSGNQTASAAPPFSGIVKATDVPGFSLPDFDVMIIDSTSGQITGTRSGVGTLLLGAAYDPMSGALLVSNMDAHNGDSVGESSFSGGRVVENRLARLGGTTVSQTPLDTGTAPPVAMPTDIAVDASGRVFVAGYASANIGVFSTAGARLGTLPAGRGPRGVAIAPTLQRLYALNRADGTVSLYDLSGSALPTAPLSTVPLPDPTYDRVKQGRIAFIDAGNSGQGATGCFSCHQDLRKDGLAWDLSKTLDGAQPQQFQDQKGPMVTQDLRSLIDNPGYHWRGEQQDLEDFNGAFSGLLHGSDLPTADFALLKDYVFSAVYPPNPFQQMNRRFTSSATQGVGHFTTVPVDDEGTCARCHALPTGTDASITVKLGGSPHIIKTTQLRGLWTKSSSPANADNNNPVPQPEPLLWPLTVPVSGSGFFHSGIVDSVAEFINFFFPDPRLTQQQRDEIVDFLGEFDTGLAPATMYSELLNQGTVASSLVGSYLINQAQSGNCDIAATGRLFLSGAWREVGMVWRGSSFELDTTPLGSLTWPQLAGMARRGQAELLVLGVPVWSGERIGVDRDRDGVKNGDERLKGLDPKSPDSDGDGMWDGYDPQPLQNPNTIMPAGAPTVSAVTTVFTTSNSIKLTYETSVLSPSRVEYGLTTAYGEVAGDPFPQPLAPGPQTNHWRRRHTVFLRPLKDGQTYHFRVRTQGQNGQLGATADMVPQKALLSDLAPNARIDSIVMTATASGFTATVKVVDNSGAPVIGAKVNGRWAHYLGAALQPPIDQAAVTTVTGEATFASSDPLQQSGDRAIFFVPMVAVLPGGAVEWGVVPPGSLRFAWPEGFGSSQGHSAQVATLP